MTKNSKFYLSNTVAQEEINQFLNIPQQQSLLRLKYQLGDIDDAHMDAHLAYMQSMDKEAIDYALCKMDIIYFCTEFCRINDPVTRNWIPFNLWPKQIEVAHTAQTSKFTIVLKTRQFGQSWWFYGVKPLWESIYMPNSISLLYSPKDEEVIKQLKSLRVRGMSKRIPEHILGGVKELEGNRHEMQFLHPNGDMSIMYGLNPNGGRGDSGTYCVIDEADHVEDLNKIFDQVESAVNAGGRMVLVSTSNKEEPNSVYKNIFKKSWYRKERNTQSDNLADADWKSIFIPWFDHPDRDDVWYETKSREILERTGSLDELWANYPETVDQALAPAQMNKRLPTVHLEQCKGNPDYIQTNFDGQMYEPNLRVYKEPERGKRYFIGTDTAEGLDQPRTDYSSVFVVNEDGEDVCNITGKHDPAYTSGITKQLSEIYNGATAMIENNSYGFHTIRNLFMNNAAGIVLKCPFTNKDGFTTNGQSKPALYVNLAELAMKKNIVINDQDLYQELQSINKDTLKAPKGDHDDRAIAYALAQIARMGFLNRPKMEVFSLW